MEEKEENASRDQFASFPRTLPNRTRSSSSPLQTFQDFNFHYSEWYNQAENYSMIRLEIISIKAHRVPPSITPRVSATRKLEREV